MAARAVFWSGAEAAASGLLSAVSAFVVARIVGPAELGIGAAIVAVHVLLWVTVNALFADALVQRASLAADDASSAFWASALAGVLGAAVQAAAGVGLAAALGDRRLIAMGLALAAALPLVGAAGAMQGMLTRRRAYRALALRTMIGQGLGTCAGVSAALLGAGAWALVCQQLVTSAAGALCLLVAADFRPRFAIQRAPVRALLRIGVPLTASTLVQHGRYRLFALLIGALAGPAALGQIHMASRLVDTVRDLASTALWRLMLPPMAERQHDRAALQATVDRFVGAYGLVLFPLCGAMLATMAPLVALLLGPVWAPSGRAALPLILLAAYNLLLFAGNVATIARGRPAAFLAANAAATAATLLGVAVLRPADPVDAAWIWLAAQVLVSPYAIAVVARAMQARPWRQARAGLPALALAAAATIAALAVSGALAVGRPLPLIAVRLAIGSLVYLPLAWLLTARARLVWREAV